MSLPALAPKPNWRELESAGYIILRNFISDQERKALLEDFASGMRDGNENYPVKAVRPRALERLKEKVGAVAQQVGLATTISVNTLYRGTYFSTRLGIDFDWHQDHESYYLFQNHYHYLNFYISLQTADPRSPNLSLLPFDQIDSRFPRLAEFGKGRGASRLLVRREKTAVLDDLEGGLFSVDGCADEISVCPVLDPGDLLLFRGDTYHKTNNQAVERVAVSFRVLDENRLILRSEFLKTCPFKDGFMKKNMGSFAPLQSYFANEENAEISIADYLKQAAR
jgi:ectoine hydroxylase-related dioxygenase (phytanoyl-CoA dioxygenase family)